MDANLKISSIGLLELSNSFNVPFEIVRTVFISYKKQFSIEKFGDCGLNWGQEDLEVNKKALEQTEFYFKN